MRGICKRFGATAALDDVSIAVEPGQVMALVGENGAGKSTLMKVLSGAIEPDAGLVRLDGKDYRPANPLDARRAGVAMIYQELSLAPHLSVEENIVLGMEPRRLGFVRRGEMRRLAMESLAFFNHPEIRPEVRVDKLSVGAQQLVEIARAIAVGSKVLVLDEPTSSLGKHDVERLFELIGKLRSQGHSIVYISHFIEEVKQVADCVTVLRDGKSVGTGLVASLTANQIVGMMIGRQVDELYPHSAREAGEAILEINDLKGTAKPVSATLTLRRGEVVGIAGLVGVGRTELLRTIFGLEPVAGGTIKVGVYAGPSSPLGRWRQGVGLLSENRKEEGLATSLSIADNVTLSKLDVFGRMGVVLPGRQAAAATRWIEKLDIRCRGARQKVSDLSGGNQQKVAIARLLQHDVDVLLLDEPTRGIDVAAKATIYKLIDELAAGSGGAKPKAVLVVSSYLPELMGICDRVAVMCRGVLGPARSVARIDEQMIMLEATGQA
jgi:ribose transport system ATP-binding protein